MSHTTNVRFVPEPQGFLRERSTLHELSMRPYSDCLRFRMYLAQRERVHAGWSFFQHSSAPSRWFPVSVRPVEGVKGDLWGRTGERFTNDLALMDIHVYIPDGIPRSSPFGWDGWLLLCTTREDFS